MSASSKPIITLVFNDGSTADMEYDTSGGGLVDEEQQLGHVKEIRTKLKCNKCGTVKKVTIEDFEDVSTEEREMGPEVYYSGKAEEENCDKCGNHMDVDIELTTYSAVTYFHNYTSNGCTLA